MIEGILMIIIGIIAAMSLITSVLNDSKKVLHLINPFQGYFGIFALCWGIWGIVSLLLDLSWVLQSPVWRITLFIIYIIEVVIGFISTFSLFSKYILKRSDVAQNKAEELIIKLIPYKISLGLTGICIGIWSIIYKLIIADIIKI